MFPNCQKYSDYIPNNIQFNRKTNKKLPNNKIRVMLTCTLRAHVKDTSNSNYVLKTTNFDFKKSKLHNFQYKISIHNTLTSVLRAHVSIFHKNNTHIS